jgi:hypothetical protein
MGADLERIIVASDRFSVKYQVIDSSEATIGLGNRGLLSIYQFTSHKAA